MGAFYNVVADCDKTMSKKGMKSKKLSKSKSLKKLKPKGLSLKSIESDPPSVVTSFKEFHFDFSLNIFNGQDYP